MKALGHEEDLAATCMVAWWHQDDGMACGDLSCLWTKEEHTLRPFKILTNPTLKMMTTFDEALYDANFIETLNNIMMPLSLAVNLNIWWPWRQTLEDDMIKNMMAPTHIGWHLLACPMAHMPWSWGHAHGEDDVAKKCWNKKFY